MGAVAAVNSLEPRRTQLRGCSGKRNRGVVGSGRSERLFLLFRLVFILQRRKAEAKAETRKGGKKAPGRRVGPGCGARVRTADPLGPQAVVTWVATLVETKELLDLCFGGPSGEAAGVVAGVLP